jgi:DNA-binding beta-propeller fold protein YncE
MRSIAALFSVGLAAALSAPAFSAAQPGDAAPLRLIQTVDLPGVEGDFDHFSVDLKGNRLFLAAEEHHTVEVFDLQSVKPVHSITGLDTPHSILYAPDVNRIFVVDGGKGGSCEVFDGTSYKHIKSIKLSEDADALVYDAAGHLLYIGNGGKEAGHDFSFVTVIDTAKSEKVSDIKLPSGNLEAMALQRADGLLYVNMRDKNQIALVDRKSGALKGTWQLAKVAHNTPLVLDEPNQRLFVGGRKPGVFGVLDTSSGREIATLPAADGVDDMSFDPATRRIYMACAEGFVNVYRQVDAGHYEALGKVATGNRGKIGTLVPELHRYYVVTSKKDSTPARIFVFDTAQ